jgi:hypothetical protein
MERKDIFSKPGISFDLAIYYLVLLAEITKNK